MEYTTTTYNIRIAWPESPEARPTNIDKPTREEALEYIKDYISRGHGVHERNNAYRLSSSYGKTYLVDFEIWETREILRRENEEIELTHPLN